MGNSPSTKKFLRNRKMYPKIPYSFMKDVDGKGSSLLLHRKARKSQDRLPQFYHAMTKLLNPNVEVYEGILKFDIPVIYWIEPLLIHWAVCRPVILRNEGLPMRPINGIIEVTTVKEEF